MTLVMTAGYASRAIRRTPAKTEVVEPDPAPTQSQQTESRTAVLTEEVTVTRRPSQARSDLLVADEHWGWEEMRDYVVAQIEARTGTFPRDARKEASIFKRFCTKYTDLAPLVARYAFEVADGKWKGAPVSVNRFCKESDPYFADPILEHLVSED